ncbi:hypothetical protein O181_088294 [Austropuccinia psidii MF-1]|uniref:Uncharacterized protein n=1 Tax=Austropuccinia psidii MF-1 TaxID=1389203 RepID=A0A9Q3IRD0_9BASI|nr:hypothetical protein [Austropuccinia psidii MF-1]
MNVSGLNIDVGNPKAQVSSTWSFANISITPIAPNPTNTQMDVSEGPESTPQISSKANPQSKFPREFLLNPGWNPVASNDPFGRSKQPTLNIPSGAQVHVGNEKIDASSKYVILMLEYKPFHNLICFFHGLDMAPKGQSVRCDELYASSPLVHQEKVTGHHHPYASKPRKANSRSSRETILDDEDENMSLN